MCVYVYMCIYIYIYIYIYMCVYVVYICEYKNTTCYETLEIESQTLTSHPAPHLGWGVFQRFHSFSYMSMHFGPCV